MKGLAFFDTNILVYADDPRVPEKQNLSIALIRRHRENNTAVHSLQVLQEYYWTATGKLRVDSAVAQSKVEILARGRLVRFSESDVISSIELHRLNRISFWDAMIVHAARSAGVEVLYSEDLAAGTSIAGVRIVNPFAGT